MKERKRGPLPGPLAKTVRLVFRKGPIPEPEPEPEVPSVEDPIELYWRTVHEEVELIRELRASLPDTPQLAMTADEVVAYYRGRNLEARTEAQRELDIKIISRVQPGRKAETRDDKYRVLKQELFGKENPSNSRSDRMRFIKAAKKRFRVDRRTAENNWSRLAREDAK